MTGGAASDLWGLVLAGGDGTRLQGLTRALTGAPIPLHTIMSLLRRRRPADHASHALDEAAYGSLNPWNFSRDFLAHVTDALLALRVDDVGWSDWGTPEAVERTLLSLRVVPPWRTAAARTAAAAAF